MIDRKIQDKAVEVVNHFRSRNMTLSVAESCTGGMIGASLTDIPGSSSVFYGGFILYSNLAKMSLAGVEKSVLDNYGAVSKETVEAMAQGTRERCQTDFSVAVSGVAGPGGGSLDKPVGTVWVSVSFQKKTISRLFHFEGDRTIIRKKTVKEALTMLIWE